MIKTYEEFSSKYNDLSSIFEYEEEIDSFLDDIKDMCVGYEKKIHFSNILYCFFIKDYKNKKDEIDIFLEEIKSICKSINIKFNYKLDKFIFLNSMNDKLSYVFSTSIDVNLDYFFLDFCLKESITTSPFIYEDLLFRCASRLGLKYSKIYNEFGG